MTPAEAFASIPLAAICCDSSFDREEGHLLQNQLMHRTPYRQMTAVAFAELIDSILKRLRKDHWEGLIQEAVPELTLDQQETAFALAAQLVFCDRIVQPEEHAFLETLGRILSLPTGRAEEIQAVFALLNRDTLQV
jgi:hypothetical protein